MITALAIPYQAQHDADLFIRRGGPPAHKPAGGHLPALTLAEKTLATVLRQRALGGSGHASAAAVAITLWDPGLGGQARGLQAAGLGRVRGMVMVLAVLPGAAGR